MTEHVHLRHVLSEYLEGELLLSERQIVERHLKVCALCRQEMRVLRRTVAMLQWMPRETTPIDFMDKLRIRIKQKERKAQLVVTPTSVTPFLALAQQVLHLGRLLFFPLSTNKTPIYTVIIVLGFVTVLLRTSSEHFTTTQVSPTGSASLLLEASSQVMAKVADEKPQAVAMAESTPKKLRLSITSPSSPKEALNVSPTLIWRIVGSEPTILRQQVKALVSQRVGAVVIQEEEHFIEISLPTDMLPLLREELRTLGTTNLPEAEIAQHPPTTVVHVQFIRSPSVAAPLSPVQSPVAPKAG